MTLVLASASPTRAQLLEAAGVCFEIAHPKVDEGALRGQLQADAQNSTQVAQALARAKAQSLCASMPGRTILGADQILDQDGQILSKASSLMEAEAQLRSLRGRRHSLISAAALVRDGQVLAEPCAQAQLSMRNFSDAFLSSYLAREGTAILGCVGCYRLEGLGAQLFSTIDGDYFTVLGLPLLGVLASLRELGMLDA
ncbi:MAG: septum formation protein Maf [Alphaproteobacteria bacterium]|nr:septum formation protein Maf [Alphaproteobacteria bacterium]